MESIDLKTEVQVLPKATIKTSTEDLFKTNTTPKIERLQEENEILKRQIESIKTEVSEVRSS